MHPSFAILVRQSFGPLTRGARPEDVRLSYGRCDEEEQMDHGDGVPTALVWHYWDDGVSFFFDLTNQMQLQSIETSCPETSIFGTPIFSLPENEIRSLFSSNGFFSPEEEIHEWGEKRVSYDEAGIDFYFEKGKLLSVNFSFPENDGNSFA